MEIDPNKEDNFPTPDKNVLETIQALKVNFYPFESTGNNEWPK